MPAKPPPKGQFNIRLDDALVDALDAWLAALNKRRRIKLTRSDLVRGLLEWDVENKPDWERTKP